MKLRNVGLLAIVAAAAMACDRSQDRAKPGAAPVTQSGSTDPWNAPAPAKDPLKRPLFWQLEKDGKTSYLLGTIHVGVDPNTRLPDIVWQKLEASPGFAMETDVSKAAGLDLTRKDGKTLKDELGAERWKKLEDAVGKRQAAAMMNMKPMMPATLLSLRGLPSTPPMDGVLHGRAENLKKKIVFLEPVETQISILEKWMDARMLGEMLDDLATHDQGIQDMLAAYIAGDGDKMVALHDSERELWKKHGRTDAEFAESMNDLLYKRNASWIEAIEKLHAEGGSFIAVGGAHTVGPKSVVDLLEQKGFKVTRITP
jgi:uncharacterized protein YbaP (TraB family)